MGIVFYKQGIEKSTLWPYSKSFRPRIGDYFFILRRQVLHQRDRRVSVPRIVGRKQCAALFTHRTRYHKYKLCTEFRPHIEDYFFIAVLVEMAFIDNDDDLFPSPFGVLFFIVCRWRFIWNTPIGLVSVSVLGIIFFISWVYWWIREYNHLI